MEASLIQKIRNPTIIVLDIPPEFILNRIGIAEATVVAEALKLDSSIIVIDFQGNCMGDEAATALVEAFKENSTITSVYLNNNCIGNRGATALSEALKLNTSITTVDFGYNPIGVRGATALIEALKLNTSITWMVIHNNIDFTMSYSEVRKALNINKAISELSHIFRNQMNPKKTKVRDILPPELMVKLQQYQEKRDYKYFTKIQQKTRYVQQTRKQKQKNHVSQQKKLIKDVSNSYNEYLSFNQTKNNKTFIPRKLLLQFIEHGELVFKFKSELMKKAVINKLKQILVFEYLNVIERLNTTRGTRSNPISIENLIERLNTTTGSRSNPISIENVQNLPFEEEIDEILFHIEKFLFETHHDIILSRIIQSNHKKIQQKSMSEIITELQQNKRKLGQKQNQLKQNQVKLKTKQLELKNKKKKQEIQTLNKNITELKRFKNISENNEKLQRMKSNQLSDQQNEKMETKILFYMLPDTVIQKYFDDENDDEVSEKEPKNIKKRTISQRQQQQQRQTGNVMQIQQQIQQQPKNKKPKGIEKGQDLKNNVVYYQISNNTSRGNILNLYDAEREFIRSIPNSTPQAQNIMNNLQPF